MTISGYSNAFVDLMLGWLKGLANWVLRLFNLAGGVSTSPLLWLSRNWSKLLIVFLVIGLGMDLLVWLIRWRPYWVWFRKERVIVNDDRFFANADMDKASDWEGDLAGNWDEHDYVVASTVVRRQPGGRGRRDSRAAAKGDRRAPDKHAAQTHRRRSGATKVKRHAGAEGADGRGKNPDRDGRGRAGKEIAAAKADRAKTEIFATELKKRDVSDSYEDEVFNVSNLPVFDEFDSGKKAPRKARSRRR